MKGILSVLSVIFTPARSPITRQTDKRDGEHTFAAAAAGCSESDGVG